MTADSGQHPFRLGFLTAIEISERGFVGGLLVTNHFGRPLEFQCTAPLRPNRTQEILYGPTLVPYLLGDLIGRTLLEKVGIKPHLVLTERDDLLTLRDLVSIPIAFVDDVQQAGRPPGASSATESSPSETQDAPRPENAASRENDARQELGASPVAVTELGLKTACRPAAANPSEDADGRSSPFRLGRQMLRFHAGHVADRAIARQGSAVIPADADLREPFERVREALAEAARGGGAR